MIPLSLRMRNFMCYGDQVSSLDFSGIHLVCLAGDNGHGKSAIIDAITWALWGKARASRDDELIHLGAREMEVDFEFLLADNHYRVLRQRQKNGSRGSTTLEFQVMDQGEFRSLTANSIRQTQASITETLHMEYDTFINSAFLLQGRADEFTSHPPADRKRILGEILDLSHYDYLEERAKQRSRETELALREISATLTEIEKELAHRPEYEEELKRAEEVSSGLRARLRIEEGTLRDLRAKSRELELRQDELKALTAQKQQRDSEVAQAKREIEDSRQRIAAYQEVLERAEIIEQGYQRLLAARQADEELSRKLTQHARLSQQRADTLRAIDAARGQLAVQREGLVSTVDSLEKSSRQAGPREKRLEEVRIRVMQLASRTEQRDQLLAQEQGLSNQIATLQAHNGQLKSEMGLLREKLDLLQEAEAFCPLCGSELQEGERENIEQNYQREGIEKGDLYRQNSASIEGLEQDLAKTRLAREQGDAELASLASLRGE
ncbi:MAG TPA: SMC family ATPase, partial [Anaerolineae bacterium]|nr:SMC family ATPase [Anaerolineae bacterium]